MFQCIINVIFRSGFRDISISLLIKKRIFVNYKQLRLGKVTVYLILTVGWVNDLLMFEIISSISINI